jgi:hypothetical protein
MTPQQERKRLSRGIRNIPIDAIVPAIAADENALNGRWCLVAGELSFVSKGGGETVVDWDDPLAYAQYVRWVQTQPERIHPNDAAALAFVRTFPPSTQF